jgi:hypothetical protein
MRDYTHCESGNDRQQYCQTDLKVSLKADVIDTVRLSRHPIRMEVDPKPSISMKQTLRNPFVSIAVMILCVLFHWGTHILPLRAESWPTEWRFESLEIFSNEWWQSLRVTTVPGVLYHLQESDSLAADNWSTLETTYGLGGEWICPLFPGVAPSITPPPGQPVMPSVPATPTRLAYLVIERTTTGGTLLSWTSLDDHTSRRIQLSGVTLDPVWNEFDAAYLNQHGNHFFALSPRLGDPVTFTDSAVTLGTLDTAMIADFTTHLPTITTNIQNSVAMVALYSHQPPPSGERKFYRIAADWRVDSDGDGRFDWQEIIFDNNNPFAADSDGDGNPDTAAGTGGMPSGYPTPTDAAVPTPFATIEQQTLGVTRVESHSLTQGDPPLVSVYPGYDLTGESNLQDFESAASYSSLKVAVDGFANPADFNWGSLGNFACENSINTQGEGQSSTFRYARARFRLKLHTAAPAGGYQIPLRLAVVHQSIDAETQEASFLSTPAGTPDHVDIMLQCAENKTEGTPVDVLGPSNVALNRRVIFMPIHVVTREPDIASPHPSLPPLPGPILADDTCLTGVESFVVDCDDPKNDIIRWNYGESPLEIYWMTRKLKGDGTLEEWKAIFEPNPLDPLNPLALKGAHRSVSDRLPGIYQLKAVLLLPDATQIDFPYVRMRDARSLKNSGNVPNPRLFAGQPDYFGICANPLSKAVRNKAVEWLGATGYAAANNIPIEPGNIFNPGTTGSPKCNIFVTHIANQVGATTPYFNRIRWGIPTPQTSAPIAKWDWYSNPEVNIDIDYPGWHYLDNAGYPATNPTVQNFSSQFHSLRSWQGGPCPGMTCASPNTSSGPRYGHVGIMDYDGSWINAGSLNVNKSLHLLDADQAYKPNTFRSR